MAQQPGDINLGATASPTGPFPGSRVEDVKGADISVFDVAARDAIPSYLLSVGQYVRTRTEGKTWKVASIGPIVFTEVVTAVAPVETDITTAGVQAAPARAAWNLAIVKTTAATGAVTLPLPVTPVDQDRFEWLRAAAGDCPITITSAKQIEFENQSSTSLGPMGPEYPGGWATYFASDDVWRI